MPTLLVVESLKTLTLHVAGAEVVTARDYLTNPRFFGMKRAKVFNLCRNQSYQGEGYYVSLLAAARAHRPLPSLGTIQNLRQLPLVKIASGDLDGLIQKSLSGLVAKEFELSVYFGKNLASKYDRLCRALFDHFPAPLLRATFKRSDTWKLADLKLIALSDVPGNHHEFFQERAHKYFARPLTRGLKPARYDLAILVNPEEKDAPSGPKAIDRFVRAAKQVGIRAFIVDRTELPRIAEYDALFIRETTAVNNHTFRMASRAAREGLVVIDDPDSILKCCNKVYQAELFLKHDIPCPRTLIVHAENRGTVSAELGFPCVLKKPDSAFSQGVVKAENEEELNAHLDALLADSDLVVAQAFAKSEFDWRIGVLGGKPLYACRYFMARGHWQIQNNNKSARTSYGRHETLAIEDVPQPVMDLALRVSELMGDSLYGVDIKDCGSQLMVMEVNDNPNIDVGVEDMVTKDELYLTVMRRFYSLLETKGAR